MASGVGVSPACVEEFQSLKLKQTHRYIIYQLNKTNSEIIVDRTSESEEWDDFLADLPESEPRYAVCHFKFEKDDGTGVASKLVFVSWSPDNARIKHKMLYASSREALRKELSGIAMEIYASDYDEVSYESVLEKASRRN
jgi:cofilin